MAKQDVQEYLQDVLPSCEELTREPVVLQILSLSSGTLATLSGETNYGKLDAIRYNWWYFSLVYGEKNETWQTNWKRYLVYRQACPDWFVYRWDEKRQVTVWVGWGTNPGKSEPAWVGETMRRINLAWCPA